MTTRAELNALIEASFPLGQRRFLVQRTLDDAFSALDELRKFGVNLSILPIVASAQPQEWPKMVYHEAAEGEVTIGPLIVYSQEELDGLEGSWSTEVRPHPIGREPQIPHLDAGSTPTDPNVARQGAAITAEATDRAAETGKGAGSGDGAITDAPTDGTRNAWLQAFLEARTRKMLENATVPAPPSAEQPGTVAVPGSQPATGANAPNQLTDQQLRATTDSSGTGRDPATADSEKGITE